MKRIYILIILFSLLLPQYESFKILAIPSFTNLTDNEKYDWYNEALSDMLTTDISATNKVRVVSRNELKKIIDEQKLSTSSGLMSDETQVSIGNMLGANLIISGSYTIVGDIIRIDIKSFDVERGTVESASTIQGEVKNIFKLEKKLALKTIESLGIELSDEDKITLFQIESDELLAVENNYKGIIALDNNNTKAAESYFKKATDIDPYYKEAKINYDNTTLMSFSGSSLFSNISSELESKDKQLSSLKKMYKTFNDSYWVVDIKGKPEPITTAGDSRYVDIEVPIEFSFNHDAIRTYVESLKGISKGSKDMSLAAKDVYYDKQNFTLYKESYDWLSKQKGEYKKDFNLVFLDNEGIVIASGIFEVKRLTNYGYSSDHTMPNIYLNKISSNLVLVNHTSSNNKLTSNLKLGGQNGSYSASLRLKGIPISHINKMAGVEIR